MTDVERDAPPLIAGAHRLIRALAPGEGPFSGDLVSSGGDVCVRVDAAALAGWAGWRFAGADHVAAPLDLARRADGHDVLLPWCTERVVVFLGRRRAGGEPIDGGEVSTLLASVLRGLDDLGEQSSAQRGEWWLTSDGRPVFVLGDGDAAVAASLSVLAALSEAQTDRATARVLERLREALADVRRVLPVRDRWEEEFFELAAPRALRTSVYGPATARIARTVLGEGVDAGGGVGTSPSGRDAYGSATDEGRSGVLSALNARWLMLARRLGAARERWRAARGAGARVRSSSTPDAWGASPAKERSPASRPRWRRPMLVGGVTAALLIAVGVLWPTGDPDGASAVAPAPDLPGSVSRPSASSEPVPAAAEPSAGDSAEKLSAAAPTTATETAPTTAAETEDALSALSGLLVAAAGCADADEDTLPPSCSDIWADPTGRNVTTLRARADTGSLTLVEDYGDLAALRWDAHAADDASQMIVLIRVDERWRVRDVYDVANPPSQ